MSDKLPGISGAHFGDHHAAPFIGGPGGSPVQFGMTMIRAKPRDMAKSLEDETGLRVIAARGGLTLDFLFEEIF